MNCSKLNKCSKVNAVLGQDMLPCQYIAEVNKTCQQCMNRKNQSRQEVKE